MPLPTKLLGLTHMTSSYSLREIIASESIEAEEKCRILGENVTYAFYGRASFRGRDDFSPTDLACLFPSLLIVDPERIPRPRYVFSFDSGAYVEGLMDQYTHPKMPLFDFLLAPNPEAAARLVGAAFSSPDDYLDNRPNHGFTVPASNFEADSYKKILLGGGHGQIRLDDRISTPELVFADPISLTGSVRAVILPDTLASDPLLGGRLRDLGITVFDYPVVSCSRPGESLSVIRQLARSYYKSLGWL